MGLTCLSCASYRRTGCLDNLIAWPNAVLADCPMGVYEPGSDEAEDTPARGDSAGSN